MYYKVFLDTNCFESAGFNFDNGLFNQLRSYARKGTLNLQINAVVEGEVRSHIKSKISETVDKIRRSIKKEHYLAGFRDIHEGAVKPYRDKFSCLSLPENEIWISDAIERFNKLLNDLAVERIPVSAVSIDDMLSDYFQKQPPFEDAKPYEFKDAIFVRSVLLEIERLSHKNQVDGSNDHSNLIFSNEFNAPVISDEEFYREDDDSIMWRCRTDDLLYLVVSNDEGVRKSFENAVEKRPNEDVLIFEKLPDLLGYIAKQEHRAFMLDEMLVHNYGIDEISETVRIVVEDAEIDIEGYEGYIEEIEIKSVELDDAFTNVIGIQRLSDESVIATVTVYTTVAVKLIFTYMNEDQSPWDRETK